MAKSKDAFRTISEVADWLGTQPHVLRFWETKFAQIKPIKRAGGRRYYRPGDMLLVGGLKQLLHEDGLTIKGAQKVLREKGLKHVQSLSPQIEGESPQEEEIEDAVVIEEAAPEVKAAPEAAPEPAQVAMSFTEGNVSQIKLLTRKALATPQVDRAALEPIVADLKRLKDKLTPAGPNW